MDIKIILKKIAGLFKRIADVIKAIIDFLKAIKLIWFLLFGAIGYGSAWLHSMQEQIKEITQKEPAKEVHRIVVKDDNGLAVKEQGQAIQSLNERLEKLEKYH